MWLGEKHKEALATLRYGILDNKGFLLLTGDVGTGKTTLINTLIASLSDDVIYASIPDPSLDKMDFFNYIASSFGIGCEFTSKGKFLSSFSKFLHSAYEKNKKVLLIIDESQLMTQDLLEETRLLSNIVTKDSNPLLNIFFVGQYEFNELIRRPENRAIAQRLTLNYYIEPLSLEETGEYIRHRLKIAGTIKKIFNPSAIREIYAFSNGFPRRINIICDHSLMSGYAEDLKTITGAIVKESSKDLKIPECRREQLQESKITVPQPAVLGSIQSQPIYQSGHPTQPIDFSEISQQGEAGKSPRFRPIGTFLLIILVLMSCFFLFPDFVNKTYKETIDYLASIQDNFSLSSKDVSLKNIQPDPQGKEVTIDNNNEQKSIPATENPLPAKKTNLALKKEKTVSVPERVIGKPYESKNIPKKDKINVEPLMFELTKVIPAATEQKNIKPVMPESARAEPELVYEGATKDSTDKKPKNPSLPLPKESLVLRFQYDSNLFSVSDIERMKEFAMALKVHPEAKINISGYTDSTGDEGYNRRLSQFRANMVKSFLMGQDLPPEQIRAQGFGSENPVDRNDTAQGRTMNRRVEISAIAKK